MHRVAVAPPAIVLAYLYLVALRDGDCRHSVIPDPTLVQTGECVVIFATTEL